MYHKDNGEPRPSSTPTQNSARKAKFDGKLLPGSYQFPFSIPFPAQVDFDLLSAILPSASEVVHPFSDIGVPASPMSPTNQPYIEPKSPGRSAPASSIKSSSLRSNSPDLDIANERRKREPRRTLSGDSNISTEIALETPQSFIENTAATIFYELVVRIVHGRFRPDNKYASAHLLLISILIPQKKNRIKAPITYIPAVVAQPATIRRQQAYENAALIPGPHSDPEGWLSLPTTVLRGSLTGTLAQNVAIECTVSLIVTSKGSEALTRRSSAISC